jgi:hypothetical protein
MDFFEGPEWLSACGARQGGIKAPELVFKPIFWVESPLDSTIDRPIHRVRFPN